MPEEEELQPDEIENIIMLGGVGVGADGHADGFGSGLAGEGYDDEDEVEALGISAFGLINNAVIEGTSEVVVEEGGGGKAFGGRNRSRGSLAALRDARTRNMSLGCGDDVWRDLFTVVPATTSAAAASSDALDFIAY
jgi:hypothetical protein